MDVPGTCRWAPFRSPKGDRKWMPLVGADLDDSDTVYEAARRGGSPGVLNYAIHHAGLYRPGSSQLMYFLLHGSWGLSTPGDL